MKLVPIVVTLAALTLGGCSTVPPSPVAPVGPASTAAPVPTAATPIVPTPTTTTPEPSPSSAAPQPAPSASEVVVRVIDGDTFVVASGRTVRVLGIDSCETDTAAGSRATLRAEGLLAGTSVLLKVEPGVGVDRYGRALRYVELPGGRDFGSAMVREDHTGVYQGRNDASAAYISALTALDGNGRTCSDPVAPVPTSANVPDADVPPPNPPNPRSPVGRDGDGDGLCNESTVPVPC